MTGDSVARKVTLPDFWASSPDLWFVRAEGEFTLKAISAGSTKHAYLVSALKEEHALKVQDSLRAPDPTLPYTKLREALLAAYQASDHQKACTLLDLKALPSERPSEILDKMLALLPVVLLRPTLAGCFSPCSFASYLRMCLHTWWAALMTPFVRWLYVVTCYLTPAALPLCRWLLCLSPLCCPRRSRLRPRPLLPVVVVVLQLSKSCAGTTTDLVRKRPVARRPALGAPARRETVAAGGVSSTPVCHLLSGAGNL